MESKMQDINMNKQAPVPLQEEANNVTSESKLSLKLTLGDQVKRSNIASTATFAELYQVVGAAFPDHTTLSIRFTDDEQDLCELSNDAEWKEAKTLNVEASHIKLFVQVGASKPTLATDTTIPTIQSQHPVTDASVAPSVKSHTSPSKSGVMCAHCQQPIAGTQFTCTVCVDYWLCTTCEAKDVHVDDHPLLMIKTARPPRANVHNHVRCDGCHTAPITGPRYKCQVCPNFDLCGPCEAKNEHPEDHPFLKLQLPEPSLLPNRSQFTMWNHPLSWAPPSGGCGLFALIGGLLLVHVLPLSLVICLLGPWLLASGHATSPHFPLCLSFPFIMLGVFPIRCFLFPLMVLGFLWKYCANNRQVACDGTWRRRGRWNQQHPATQSSKPAQSASPASTQAAQTGVTQSTHSSTVNDCTPPAPAKRDKARGNTHNSTSTANVVHASNGIDEAVHDDHVRATQVTVLESLGYSNRLFNEQLLLAFQGNLARVVQHLQTTTNLKVSTQP